MMYDPYLVIFKDDDVGAELSAMIALTEAAIDRVKGEENDLTCPVRSAGSSISSADAA